MSEEKIMGIETQASKCRSNRVEIILGTCAIHYSPPSCLDEGCNSCVHSVDLYMDAGEIALKYPDDKYAFAIYSYRFPRFLKVMITHLKRQGNFTDSNAWDNLIYVRI